MSGTPANSYSGNAQHLASWGYIVALPNFSDCVFNCEISNIEKRMPDLRYVFSYLETENMRVGSSLYQKVDINRFGAVGHSLGGATSLFATARDNRIKAVVALDPASGSGSMFSSAPSLRATAVYTDFITMTAPAFIVGTPSQPCNGSAEYNALYVDIASEHKEKSTMINGSHCDFMDTTDTTQRSLCYQFCGGGSFSQARLTLAERYTTAWFNYYLQYNPSYFAYAYGAKLNEDIQAGVITSTFQTAPRGLAVSIQHGAAQLTWILSDYPMIAGYNIYRSQQSGVYLGVPYSQVNRASFYTDTNLTPATLYFYTIRSRDAAGNEHQPSAQAQTRNDAPVATSDNYSTNKNTQLQVSISNGVLRNDSDANGDPLTAFLASNPTQGTLTWNPDGSFSYIPSAGYVGSDGFTYRAFDGTAYSNTATVTIFIHAENNLPMAGNDTFATNKNTLLHIAAAQGLVSNDTDSDGDTLTVVLASGTLHGNLDLKSDGSFDYLPNLNYVGADNFTYRAYDGIAFSNIATVSLTVNESVTPAGQSIYLPTICK